MLTAIALVALVSASVQAQDQNQQHDDHQHDEHATQTSAPSDAPITITINPEVRVSVKLSGDLPPPAACGKAIELPVKIINQGFLTAPLLATLVDSVPEGVSLEFSEEPLKGILEEDRIVRLTLMRAQPVDVTISFRAKNDVTDLGGRDRIHLLVQCQQEVAHDASGIATAG